MSSKMDTKELTEIVDGVCALVNLGIDVGKDGKVDLSDGPRVLAHIPELIKVIPAAVIDGDKAIPELKDIDEEEAAKLAAHAMAKLAVDNEKAKRIVEKSLLAAVAIAGLVREIASKE